MDGGLWLHRHVWKGRQMAHLVSTDRERLLRFGATIGLGAMATVNLVPDELARSYGSRTPVGGLLFLRLRPRFASAGGMAGMEHSSPLERSSPRSFK